MSFKISEHKEEIIDLKINQGYGSYKIANYIKEKYGNTVDSASIRASLRRWGASESNTFTKELEGAEFSLPDKWSYGWLKTEGASIFIKNQEEIMTLDDVCHVIKEAVKDIKPIDIPKPKTTNKKSLRAILTDAHVGMEPTSRDALFNFKYDKKVFKKHLSIVFDSITSRVDQYGSFDQIIVDDLGDGLDGFNSETTRGGHHLPQNMDNKTAWETYVFSKIDTYVKIVKLGAASKYVFRNVANCNHSGDFGWTANMAIKMAMEQMFDNVEYLILERSMEHFTYGDHCFILTHGKDKSLMVKNWPLQLTDKVSNIIRQYIDHYDIKSKYIHLDKGDLHQCGYAREPKFDYRNFMSFAPPSQWVQANFGVSYCGFSIQVIPKNSNQIEHTDIFFDMKKK